MFLFDPTFAENYANVEKEVERIMQRAGAEIVLAGKWDDRKLAYEIKRRKRGYYVLVYFKAPPERIAGIERDCRLSESILRVLIVSAEGVSQEAMKRAFEQATGRMFAGPAGEGEPGRADRDEDRVPPDVSLHDFRDNDERRATVAAQSDDH